MASSFAAALVLFGLGSTPRSADVKMKEERPGLLQKAKIDAVAATSAARTQVPNGKIVSAEIEVERGTLLYYFDIKTEGKVGIEEVNVDAVSGKVIGVQHESPGDEANEAAVDRRKP